MTAHSQNPQEIPAQHADPEAQVEKMFEYGYRKSNYGPDELVTDAHGNPISVTDAMMTAREAAETPTTTPHLCCSSIPFASCTPRPGMWRTPRYEIGRAHV